MGALLTGLPPKYRGKSSGESESDPWERSAGPVLPALFALRVAFLPVNPNNTGVVEFPFAPGAPMRSLLSLPTFLLGFALALSPIGCVRDDAPKPEDVTVDHFGRKQGPAKTWHPTGELNEQGHYYNDEKDGEWNSLHPNGQLSSSGRYDDGDRVGEWTQWHANGQMSSLGHYDTDQREGTWQTWYPNGTPESTGEYLNGEPHGRWMTWHPNGQQASLGWYRHSLRHGPWRRWHDNGEVSIDAKFREGSRVGDWIRYQDDGKEIFRQSYPDDEKDRGDDLE